VLPQRREGLDSRTFPGGSFSLRNPGGTGPLSVIRGHELSCTASFQVDPGMRVGTLLRADPNQWGSVLVAVGINVNPRPSRGVY